MQIVPVQPSHLDVLRNLYIDATLPVPHCRFTPSVALFHAALMQPRADTMRILVAEEIGMARGFAALRRLSQEEFGAQRAGVTALFFTDDTAGQGLLEACETQARMASIEHMLAFPNTHGRCPIPSYNGGWDGLSDRIPATARLLARHGYTPYYRELHMTCGFDRFPPLSSAAPAGIMVEGGTDGRSHFTLSAMAERQMVGVCIYSTLERLSDDPVAAEWGYIWGLEVEAAFRRRGIARHLLTSAMVHLSAQGCQGCWLTTGMDNWPAQPLYLALGFEIVDTSACFRKTLTS